MSMTHLIDKLYAAREQSEQEGDKEAARVITNAIKELSKYNPNKEGRYHE